MGEVLKKFGRYFLLDHLAQGGMAEIYRARLASADGAGRLIAIKRIHAGYGANAEFLQMFKSEIKVTMGFNHPNIVQVYDFGEELNQPYIAMEWVDGRNLKQFIGRTLELQQPFPIELAIYIIEQAASGLNYAHSFKDKISGVALNIVHRDISPQNILIAFEGNVKVIDFGIAKATTNLESTRSGVIKGKPSYLSPEQISGDVLDGRSDIFALGAVLWECLTGKKLFAGESDLAVLKLIESAQTHVKPPSTVNPKVPKELDYLVLRSLAKQRDKRFQSAEEFQRALHKLLYSYAPEFNPADLSYYAKDLFKNEIVDDRKQIQKLNDKAEQLLASNDSQSIELEKDSVQLAKEDERTVVDKKMSSSNRMVPLQSKQPVIEVLASAANTRSQPAPTQRPVLPQRPAAPQQRAPSTQSASGDTPNKRIAMGAAALLLLSVFGPEFGIKVPILSEFFGDWIGGNETRLILQGNQKGVVVAVNGETVATSLPATLSGIPVGTPFRVSVTGPNGTFQQQITLKKGEQRSIAAVMSGGKSAPTSAQTALVGPDKGVLLRMNITPGGAGYSISLNGASVPADSPSIRAPLDAPLELSIIRPGFRPFKREFVLETRQLNGLKEWSMDVQLEPLQFGFITIHTTPSADAIIPMDGYPWKRKTPIENEKLPVGQYTIRLVNEVLGMEKTLTIDVQEGKSINVDERLEIKN